MSQQSSSRGAGRAPAQLLLKGVDRLLRESANTRFLRPYGERLMNTRQAEKAIADAIDGPNRFVVSRLGSVEQHVLGAYLASRALNPDGESKYPRSLRREASVNAGLSPATNLTLDFFARSTMESLTKIDLLGVWFHGVERLLVRKALSPAAYLIPLATLDPLHSDSPWSEHLENKRVCVVHPFARTIENQYARRAQIFRDQRYLPKFELSTVEAVQSMGALPPRFDSWEEALSAMAAEVRRRKPEIVLLGVGAYGTPLASLVADPGVRVLHLGGSLQLLFGIMGARWEHQHYVIRHATSAWTRASQSETPGVAAQVEGGCYW